MESLIRVKETKVAAWLLGKTTELPAQQARIVVERASALEKKLVSRANEPTDRLKGIWSWNAKKLEFAPGGVAMVNKSKGGKWMWGRPNSSDVVLFILEPGDVVAYAQFSKSTDGLLHIKTTKDKFEDARKE